MGLLNQVPIIIALGKQWVGIQYMVRRVNMRKSMTR